MTELYHAQQLPLFPSKVCPSCDEQKLLDEFPRNKISKVEHFSYCKICVAKRNHANYIANRASRLSQQREYREQRKEQQREYDIAYRQKNHERLLQQKREYYAANRESLLEQNKEYYQEHKQQKQEYDAAYRQKNHERKLQQGKEYYDANCEELRQKNREYRATHKEQRRQYTAEFKATHPEKHRQQCKLRNHRYNAQEHVREQNRQKLQEWRLANPLESTEQRMRYIARKKEATIDTVSYEAIIERDGWHCYICDGPILPEHKFHFDHVIPLTRGGAHSEDNVKVTHQQCNLRKSYKLLSELDDIDRSGV